MPQAFAAWAASAYAGTAVTGFATAGATGVSALSVSAATAAIYAGAYVVATVAITAGLTAVSRELSNIPKTLRGQTQEYNGTVAQRTLIYGTTRVSGMNVIPPIVSGADGAMMHQVLALAGHEVSGISSVWFNQEEITNANITAITQSASDGLVTAGTFKDYAWIRRYDGTQTAVDTILDGASGYWTMNHIGYGISYLAIQYKYDKSVYGPIGKPEVSCLVAGKKVYDPRKDSTEGGSGSHRHTDDLTSSPVVIAADTWEYSANPALCLADYLCDNDLGMGEDPARIDWASVASAANECDEVVQVPTGDSPQSVGQYRYRCNIVLSVTDRYEDNIDAICTTMMGHCYYSSGKWQIHAGAWTASAFDLTEDDIIGGVTIQADTPRKDKYNSVRGQYYDAQREYQPSEFQPQTDAAYVTADGETIWREIELSGCTNEYEAQRSAIIVMRRSRNRRSLTAEFSMAAFKVKPWETGTMTLAEIGWSEQPVRCTAWEFMPNGVVRLSLIEESSTDWSNPAIGDYTFVAGASTPTAGGYTPPTVTALTVTPTLGGVVLNWTAPSSAPGTYFEIVREDADTMGSPMTSLATTYGNSYVDMSVGSSTWYYWVRGISSSGTPGSFFPATTGTSGTASETGADGNWIDIIFIRSLATPSTPTGDSPAGWSNGVPAGTDTLWMSQGTKTYAGVLIDAWSAPEEVSGFSFRGGWSAAATYYIHNTVTYGGGTYICLQTAAPSSPISITRPSGNAQATAYWAVIAAPGEPGAPGTPDSAFNSSTTISSPTGYVNLRQLADDAGYTGTADATWAVTIDADVTGSAGAANGGSGGIAIDTGTWPSNDYTIALTLTINASKVVRGGGGGGGKGADYVVAGVGGIGGDAIYCQEDLTIVNNGTIRGGSGGGGGGASRKVSSGEFYFYGGGGGGGGCPNGIGGAGGACTSGTGTSGGTGTTTTAGSGGAGSNSAGTGGNGGAATAATGSTGSSSAATEFYSESAGGAAGYAVRMNGNTVTTATGSYNGSWS